MLLQLWLHRLTTVLHQSSRSQKGIRRTCLPGLEALETRRLLSTFTTVNNVPTVPYSTPNAIAVGDFNEDGNQDLVTANINRTSGKDVSVFFGDGTGNFGEPEQFGLGTNPAISVAVGDFNSDGNLDIVFGRGDTVFGSDDGTDMTTLLLGNGDGTFATPLLVAAGKNPTSIAVGDFNGDLSLDLAVTNGDEPLWGSPNVSILQGNGDGTFGTRIGYAVGYTATAVAVGDFNGDEIQDLVVTDAADNKISLLQGRGDGSFQSPMSYAPGDGIYLPNSVAIGDFNEDGEQDVAVAYTFASLVVVHEGNGDGTLKPAVLFPVNGKPNQVAMGDFNGDGHPDLVTANAELINCVSVLVGTGAAGSIGSGSFLPAENYTLIDRPYPVAVGDFNNDGADDAAVASTFFYAGSLSILVGASIANVAPVIDSLSATSVNENGIVHLTGTYHDVGTQDHFLTINWGEAPAETVAVTGGLFDVTHQYLDDHPTNTASDAYTIGVTLTDDEMGEVAGSTTATVTNVPPVITLLGNSSPGLLGAAAGQVVTVSGAFTDPGAVDVHSVVINWGDGSSPTTTTLSVGTRSISAEHAYVDGGIYEVTVFVNDDDLGSVSATTRTVVTGVGLINGTLYVIGTAGKDHIDVNRQVHGGTGGDNGPVIRVNARLGSSDGGSVQEFPAGQVTNIVIQLGEGDDHAQIHGDVTVTALIDGGADNDHLKSGGGRTTLLGGSGDDFLEGGDADDLVDGGDGNDKLDGGRGRDLMIGGTGSDDLKGGDGDDLLIGGHVSLSPSGLEATRDIWSAAATYDVRKANVSAVILPGVNAFDDGANDKLAGNKDRDLFFARLGSSLGDDLKDKAANEFVCLL